MEVLVDANTRTSIVDNMMNNNMMLVILKMEVEAGAIIMNAVQ